jgi:putative membrane protein insertion efficiency factor
VITASIPSRLLRAAATVDRALGLPLVAVLQVYRALVSPLYGETCRFYPSCSAYALEALRQYGLVRGTLLTTWRLMRCNPWNAGGVDHVPPTRGSAAESADCHHLGLPGNRQTA